MTRLLLAMLAFYRCWISPALHSLGQGGGCRFVPTCSEYATIAIATHGPIRGTGLAIWRLLRCHPFSRGGLDQVPNSATNQPSDSRRFSGTTEPPGSTSVHLPHKPLP